MGVYGSTHIDPNHPNIGKDSIHGAWWISSEKLISSNVAHVRWPEKIPSRVPEKI